MKNLLAKLIIATFILLGVMALRAPHPTTVGVQPSFFAPARADAGGGCIFYATPPPVLVGSRLTTPACNSAQATIVAFATAPTITTTLPFDTSQATQAGAAGTGVGLFGWDGTANLERRVNVDGNGRFLVAGGGTAGTPAGGVSSVQGVSGGQALPVSGTFWQATQPVSGTVTANAGTGNFNAVGVGTAGTPSGGVLSVQGVASGVAQPVSGTVTANQGGAPWSVTQSGAFSTNQTLGAAGFVKLTDGTNTAGVTSGLALLVDGSGVTQPVSGSVTATISGSPNVRPGGASTSALLNTAATSLNTCTLLLAGAHYVASVWPVSPNAGASNAEIQLYNDNTGSNCDSSTTGNMIYDVEQTGGGQTIPLGAQFSAGISYKILNAVPGLGWRLGYD